MLANQLGIKQNTARKIVARALKREDPENVEEKTRGGAYHVKVDNEMRETIAEIIGENPAATLATINSELRRRLPAKPFISNNYISHVCRGMFCTMKFLPPYSPYANANRKLFFCVEVRSKKSLGSTRNTEFLP